MAYPPPCAEKAKGVRPMPILSGKKLLPLRPFHHIGRPGGIIVLDDSCLKDSSLNDSISRIKLHSRTANM